jgi:hypothetical protein
VRATAVPLGCFVDLQIDGVDFVKEEATVI